jgi:hypothetical protein
MTTMRRMMAALLIVLSLVSVTNAGEDESPGKAPKFSFGASTRKHRGEAIMAMGARLADVAKHHRMKPEQLKAMLENDSDLWVTDNSELLYICEGLACPEHAKAEQAPSANGPSSSFDVLYPLDQTFKLHSRPDATKTIFLDFDGHSLSATPWENGGPLQLRGFYNSIGEPEMREIQQIWASVAEDYAPFDVDVTTEDPGSDALRKFGTGDTTWGIRVAFTSNINLLTGAAIKNAGGGGTGYYNSFNWGTDDVCLVFNRGKYSAAETASHEAGHTLGLKHDGAGTTTVYYPGHGGTGATSWGTIMGAPYLGDDENVTQWSKGEYTGANNTQDDLAVITTANGFGYRADDHGNTDDSATSLTASGNVFAARGVVEQQSDADVFSFTIGGGSVTLDVKPYNSAPNLDVRARLYGPGPGGNLIQDVNPDTVLNAVATVGLTAGTYYVHVESSATGTPLANPPTGYTRYGSLGQYEVKISITVPPCNLQVLDPNGAVVLLRDPSTDLVWVRSNGVTYPVCYLGAQIKAAQFAGWQILAAETVGSNQNQILWKKISTGEFHVWSLDGNWSHTSSGGTFDPNSSEGLLLQQQFRVDANGTPLTAAPGDLNGSGMVNFEDLSLFLSSYGKSVDQPGFLTRANLNTTGSSANTVDFEDLVAFLALYNP